jgi:hypothetical protein
MYLKTLIAAATLAVLPGLSFAQCSQADKVDQQAMSCIPGTQWDATTSTCQPVANS